MSRRSGPWLGWVALLLAGAVMAHAWTYQVTFLHRTGGISPGDEWWRVLAVIAVALLAAAMAGAALRGAPRGGRGPAIVALVLVTPFVADAAAAPVGRAAFLVLNALVLAAIFAVAARARAVEVRRVPTAAGDAHTAPEETTGARAGRFGIVQVVVLTCATALGLSSAEVAARLRGPSEKPAPVFVIPGDETEVPLGALAVFQAFGAAGEGGAAAMSPFRPYLYMKACYDDPQWDYFDEAGCVDYVFNIHGLRDDDFELRPPENEYRLLAIGDSMTFGLGVQHEDCWTEVLQARLGAALEQPVEVVNAGFVSGYAPPQYADWILTDGVSLEPDVVLVGLCLNDLALSVGMYAYPRVVIERPLGGRSALLSLAHEWWSLRDEVQPEPLDFEWVLRSEPGLWEETRAALLRMRDELEAQDTRFVVALLPMFSGLQEPVYPYGTLLDRARDFCLEQGIEHVDLSTRFLGMDDRSLWVHSTDQHPNVMGHAMLAEGIFEYLRE